MITYPPNLDPATLQRNVESLSAIGGVYWFLAARVEQDHAELLATYRLDNSSKSVVELRAEQERKLQHYKENQMPKLAGGPKAPDPISLLPKEYPRTEAQDVEYDRRADAEPAEEPTEQTDGAGWHVDPEDAAHALAKAPKDPPTTTAEDTQSDRAGEIKADAADPTDAELKTTVAAKRAARAEALKLRQDVPSTSLGGGLFTPLVEEEEFARVLYWGQEGAGKTTDFATLANLGRVLVINAEGGLKKSALRARGVNVENLFVWPKRGEPITHEGMDAVYRELKADLQKDPKSWVGVAWDSATDVAGALVGVVGDDRVESLRGRNIDVDEWITDRNDYGKMAKQFRDLMRKYRDLPVHFVVTALERRDEDEDTSKVSYGPAVNPALQTDLLGWMDLVLYTRAEDEDRPYYRASSTKLGGRRAKDRLGVLPKVLVDPTMERVLRYLDGTLTEESDPLQAKVAEAEAALEAKKATRGTRAAATQGRTRASRAKAKDTPAAAPAATENTEAAPAAGEEKSE